MRPSVGVDNQVNLAVHGSPGRTNQWPQPNFGFWIARDKGAIRGSPSTTAFAAHRSEAYNRKRASENGTTNPTIGTGVDRKDMLLGVRKFIDIEKIRDRGSFALDFESCEGNRYILFIKIRLAECGPAKTDQNGFHQER